VRNIMGLGMLLACFVASQNGRVVVALQTINRIENSIASLER